MCNVFKRVILALSLVLIGITGFIYSQDIKAEAKRHYEIGNLYYQQGRYREAKEEFQRALDLLSLEEIKPKIEVISPDKREREVFAKKLVLAEKQESLELKKEAPVEYIIADADVLHISVWQNPDLDHEVIVRPDGKISFPLVGDMQASGLSITQLDEQLTERLREYIRFPEVSISIKKLGGRKVIVLGQVKSPGVYSVTGAKTILEAIGLAGGLTKDSVSSSVVLIRGGFQSPQANRINLSRAISAGDMRQNVALESEDIVFVPKKFIANLNYFLSQILDPISRGLYTARELRNW